MGHKPSEAIRITPLPSMNLGTGLQRYANTLTASAIQGLVNRSVFPPLHAMQLLSGSSRQQCLRGLASLTKKLVN